MNIRIASTPFYLALVLLSACSGLALDPPTVGGENVIEQPWKLHCETEKSYAFDLSALPGIYQGRWIWGKDQDEQDIILNGQLENGFFHLQSVTTSSGNIAPSEATLRQACIDTIARDQPTTLARVLAARDSRDIDVAIEFPLDEAAENPVTRVVVFGDSLSDSGKLKHRLQIFPGNPYWLGRFSNGPVWPEYLESITTLAIQNNAYGGASVVRPPEFQEAGLVGYIKEGGRFFVSGSLDQQVQLYLNETLSPEGVTAQEAVVFAIWAGANDYISKEPFSGLITTFLNTPEDEFGFKSVVNETIGGIVRQIQALYDAGGRQFLIINLPDLGKTPIALQNDTYVSGKANASEAGRRMELSRRLSRLTNYHNHHLEIAMQDLGMKLDGIDIVMVDSYHLTQSILAQKLFTDQMESFDYGFSLEALKETLKDENKELTLQQPCYSGMYLGSSDDSHTCEFANTAFFWDVVHPGTYAHCWQAYQIGVAMAEKGWIKPLPEATAYRNWCKRD